MRSDWVLPAQHEVPWSSTGRQIKSVLLEFDGPQLVVLSTPEGDQLALAVDEDDVVVRWLQAPISKLELSALLSGAQPIREVFKKTGLTVVDYPHRFESPLTVYRIGDWSDLPEAVLPLRGVSLPLSTTVNEALTDPVVRVAGEGASRDGVTLAQLAAVAGTLHETWTSIVQYVFGIQNPRPFSAFAAQHGSLELLIHSDDAELFEQVIRRYETLVRAAQDTSALGQVLATTPLAVVKVYEKHLNALDRQRVEVLAQWRGGSVFLGRGTAEAALESFPSSDVTSVRIETRPHRGYFDGFWAVGRRWRFSFFDIDMNESFTGRIGREIRTEWARDLARRDAVFVGSPQQKYLIEVVEQLDANGTPIDRSLLTFSRID